MDLRKNVLGVGQVKSKVLHAHAMIVSANHLIKQVMVAEEVPIMCGEEKPFLLDLEMEEELVDELPNCMMTEEVTEKTTMVIMERRLLVPELKEAPKGEIIGYK